MGRPLRISARGRCRARRATRHIRQLDDPILEDQKGYVYPPQLVLLLVPLTLLPTGVVGGRGALGMLALLGLTSGCSTCATSRCYAAALLWVPTISGVLLVEPLDPARIRARRPLAVPRPRRGRPGSRSGWRSRPSCSSGRCSSGCSRRVGCVLAAGDRRSGRRDLGGVGGIGFDGLAGYPDLLRRLSEIQAESSYSIVGMAATAGLAETSVGR